MAALLISQTPTASAAEHVSCSQRGATRSCTIVEPNVRQRLTEYPQVFFHKGDVVEIRASGCVQTGGHGQTWKRYVDPSGANSDHLYHGLVSIPGATVPAGQLVRIARVQGLRLSVQQDTYLRLGYEDDDYGDNGYRGHDDGTEDQCRGVGPAKVIVQSRPGGTSTTSVPSAPLDLIWSQTDQNGLPLNPIFQMQQGNVAHIPDVSALCGNFKEDPSQPLHISLGSSPCTTQATGIDVGNPSTLNGLFCSLAGERAEGSLPGHVNLIPVTFTGQLYWGSHKSWHKLDDDDYNMELQPHGFGGLTKANSLTLRLEYDSDETIDHFATRWWNDFHTAVDDGNPNPLFASSLSDPGPDASGHFAKEAIVIGLFGFDNEHSAHSELHPVYGLAIHVKSDPQDDIWAIFVRNWGNEGYCSQFEHPLDLTDITFFLPRPGATDVSVVSTGTEFKSHGASTWAVTPAQNGAYITFHLGSPDTQNRINGQVSLRWTTSPNVPKAAAVRLPPLSVEALRQQEHGMGEVEEMTKAKIALSPQQAQQLAALLRKPAAQPDSTIPTVTSGLPAKPASPPVSRTGKIDAKKQALYAEQMRALCQVTGGRNLPANACRAS